MLWICRACTTAYSVGARACPECGSTEYAEEGQEMPKITRHGGPSYEPAEDDGGQEVASEVEQAAGPVGTEPGCTHPDCKLDHPHDGPAILGELPPAADAERKHPGTGEPMTADDATEDDTEGGDQSSPGSSSSTSDAKRQTSTGKKSTGGRKPAQTTESPSSKAPTGSSTARSTGGSTPETTSADKAD